MLEFIQTNGIYLLAGIVVIFVLVTFLLSRKPEKVKQEKKTEQIDKRQSEPVFLKEEPVKVESEEPIVAVIQSEPVIVEKQQVVEKQQEVEPVVEPPKAEVKREEVPVVAKPEKKAPKPKAPVKKEVSEPVKESEPVKVSEPIVDEDADEEAALKRIVKNPKYHISMNKDDASPYFKKWRVRKEGSTKTIKYFDTQKLAIEYAQDLAEKANTGVVIHKVDGSIRKQDYSKK